MVCKYIYGPVLSWRLGSSLGIDLLSGDNKVCSFDCIYCQLGEGLNYEIERRLNVPTPRVIEEIERLPEIQIDYITLSGMGEPTLAENLGESIEAIKGLRGEPVAVLTNSSLMNREDVRRELSLADLVVAKLDTPSQRLFDLINRPVPGISFDQILEGIGQFREEYRKRLALQIMFIEENRDRAGELVELANRLQPDEVQINTPLRPCPVKPLAKEAISKIKRCFEGLNTLCVYGAEDREIEPISQDDTLKRRGGIL